VQREGADRIGDEEAFDVHEAVSTTVNSVKLLERVRQPPVQ
jgi:hypothetical protein